MANVDEFETEMMDPVENGEEAICINSESEMNGHFDDQEMEAIKARIQEIEGTESKPKRSVVHKPISIGSPTASVVSSMNVSHDDKVEVDSRSIYVGNVDYGASAVELESYFLRCGYIIRVTILCNKFDGHPKGYAYIEFADIDSVYKAMGLDGSLFRGRPIKVNPKRTNRPGLSMTNRGFRGGRWRSRFYGGYRASRRAMAYRNPFYYAPY